MRFLSQNPHKFFPDERFGDESPVLALRPSARCRVNSTPAAESMFTDLQAVMGLHPPLPPPPPPYHPPTTQQIRNGWRPRVPTHQPSRSFSYPCNHSLLHTQTSSKMGSPIYPATGVKAVPPDCTNPQGRSLNPNKKGVSTRRQFMGVKMVDCSGACCHGSQSDNSLPLYTVLCRYLSISVHHTPQ